jgi:hypothetical protein
LKGATLGDLGDDDGDTLSWVKRNKKVIKEMEKRKMKELEEMDNLFQGTYGEGVYSVSFECTFLMFCDRRFGRSQSQSRLGRVGRRRGANPYA